MLYENNNKQLCHSFRNIVLGCDDCSATECGTQCTEKWSAIPKRNVWPCAGSCSSTLRYPQTEDKQNGTRHL